MAKKKRTKAGPSSTGKSITGRRTQAVSKGGQLQEVSQWRQNKKDQRDRQDHLLRLYAHGKSLDSIALDLDLDMRAVVNSISTALDRQVKNFAEPSPQHQFVRYAIFNMGLIEKLDNARRMFLQDPEGKQYAMIVSSIRAQHEIYEAIQKKGLTLGVIQKRKANAEAISGGKRRVLKELAREAELLLDIVDEFDPHTQFRRRRRIQAKITAREAEISTPLSNDTDENGRPFVALIRKVMREHGLVVRDRPNKMFKTKVYVRDSQGRLTKPVREKPKSKWTLEDYATTSLHPPPELVERAERSKDHRLGVIDVEYEETLKLGQEVTRARQEKKKREEQEEQDNSPTALP